MLSSRSEKKRDYGKARESDHCLSCRVETTFDSLDLKAGGKWRIRVTLLVKHNHSYDNTRKSRIMQLFIFMLLLRCYSSFVCRLPMRIYVILAFFTVATMGLSNASIGYLNYPTQVRRNGGSVLTLHASRKRFMVGKNDQVHITCSVRSVKFRIYMEIVRYSVQHCVLVLPG